MRLGWRGVVLSLVGLMLLACGDRAARAPAVAVAGGDPARGRVALQAYGCGSCHTIPGVPQADAQVGPPLTAWSQRHYIAGALPNTPANLIRWIMEPQSVEPGTVMPGLSITEPEARDMAAYLFGLQ